MADGANGGLAGSLAVEPIADGREVELHWVYVAIAARGGGLAQALWRRALDFAHAREARAITLWSDSRFLRGHAFYSKLGFRRLAETRHLGDISDTTEHAFRLEL